VIKADEQTKVKHGVESNMLGALIQTVTVFDTRRRTVAQGAIVLSKRVVQKQAEIRWDQQSRGCSRNDRAAQLCGTGIAQSRLGVNMMSLVRLLGFTTLGCGCVTGRYREVATNREITYVEEKGNHCTMQSHRRNHTVTSSRAAVHTLTAKAS
jgi:hypothetical protein